MATRAKASMAPAFERSTRFRVHVMYMYTCEVDSSGSRRWGQWRLWRGESYRRGYQKYHSGSCSLLRPWAHPRRHHRWCRCSECYQVVTVAVSWSVVGRCIRNTARDRSAAARFVATRRFSNGSEKPIRTARRSLPQSPKGARPMATEAARRRGRPLSPLLCTLEISPGHVADRQRMRRRPTQRETSGAVHSVWAGRAWSRRRSEAGRGLH